MQDAAVATTTTEAPPPVSGPVAEFSTFVDKKGKAHAMICLKRTQDDRWPFEFGLGKAELVRALFPDILQFLQQNGR